MSKKMEQIGTAIEVKKLKKWRGDARLYKLNPPINFVANVWDFEPPAEQREYIVISRIANRWEKNDVAIYISDKKAYVENERDAYLTSNQKTNVAILERMGYTLVKEQKVQPVKVIRAIRLVD